MGEDSNFWGLAERDTRQVILYNTVRNRYKMGKFVMVLPESYHYVSTDMSSTTVSGIELGAREFGADSTVPIIRLSKHKREKDASKELEDAAKDFYANYEIVNLHETTDWEDPNYPIKRSELDLSWKAITTLKKSVDVYFRGLIPGQTDIFAIQDAMDIETLVHSEHLRPYQRDSLDKTIFTKQIFETLDIKWTEEKESVKQIQEKLVQIRNIEEDVKMRLLSYLLDFQYQQSGRTTRIL